MASLPGKKRIAGKPVQRFKSIAASLESLISSIAFDWEDAADAPEPTAESQADNPMHRKLRKAQLLITELHSTTRETHGVIESLRNEVETAKQSMDANHLQLENLLYERDHLLRETQLCKDFTMTELEKVEDDEEQGFLESVDELQSREEHAHNLTILSDQKDKRRNAQRELEAAQIRVKAVNAAISESRQYLDKFPDYLKDVEKALGPLRKNMPWRPGARRGRHDQATELPGPLFSLYCQLEAYCDSVCADECSRVEDAPSSSLVAYERDGADEPLLPRVTLVPAKTYVSASAKADADRPEEATDRRKGDRRAGAEPEGSSAKRQRIHYRTDDGPLALSSSREVTRVSRREAGRSMLEALTPFPIEVLLTLPAYDADATSPSGKAATAGDKRKGIGGGNTKGGDSFTFRFSYLPVLGIVAVNHQASHQVPSTLANLFPNDTGMDTPNPANHHGRAARVSPSGIFQFPADVPCRPYRWAQWLAGLHFPPSAPLAGTAGTAGEEDERVASAIEPSTRAVVAQLRSRMHTCVSLAAQLKNCSAKGLSPSAVLQDGAPDMAGGIELRGLKELSGSELQTVAKGFQARDNPVVGSTGGVESTASDSAPKRESKWERYGARYFKGTLKMKKGRARDRNVELQVEVPAEYPLRPSLINLEETGSAEVQEELRNICNEVNAHYDTLLTEDVGSWDSLLSKQISLAMECLVARPVAGFGRLRRGRMRRKPVLFDRLERTFVHR